MADNIAITAGSGTNVATDQLAGGEHVQFIKVMDGTFDSSNKLVVDANGYLLAKVGPRAATIVAGNQSLTISTTSTALTVPGTATHALISVDAGDVRFWEDGTAPTSTTGILLVAGSVIELTVSANTKFIKASGSPADASLNVSYRKYV
jgi:hypothetical protein